MATVTKLGIWNRALSRVGENDLLESETEQRAAALMCALHYDDCLRELLEARQWPWAIRQRTLSNIDTQVLHFDGDDQITRLDIPVGYLEPTQVVVVYTDTDGVASTYGEVEYTLTPAADGVDAYVTLLGGGLFAGASIDITITTTRNGWEHVYALPSDCVTPTGLLFDDTRYTLVSPGSRLEYTIMLNDAGDGRILCCDLVSTDTVILEYIAAVDNVAVYPAQFVNALAWRLAAELATSLKKDPKLHGFCLQMFERTIDEASATAQNIGQDTQEPLTPSLAARG